MICKYFHNLFKLIWGKKCFISLKGIKPFLSPFNFSLELQVYELNVIVIIVIVSEGILLPVCGLDNGIRLLDLIHGISLV